MGDDYRHISFFAFATHHMDLPHDDAVKCEKPEVQVARKQFEQVDVQFIDQYVPSRDFVVSEFQRLDAEGRFDL